MIFQHVRQPQRLSRGGDLEVDARSSQMLRRLLQGLSEIVRFQRLRAEVPDGAADLGASLAHEAARDFDVLRCSGRIGMDRFGGGIELQRRAGQDLLQRIVQLTGEARAFRRDGCETHLRLLSRGDLRVKLMGSLLHPELELIVRFLQLVLGRFGRSDLHAQLAVFSRAKQRPGECPR
jgi:hypothetical protein